MTRILPRVCLKSTASADALLDALQIRGKDWRESRLGRKAQQSGIVRWNIVVAGREVRLSPVFGARFGKLRLQHFANALVCKVVDQPSGSVLTGSFRPSKKYLLVLLLIGLNPILYPMLVVFSSDVPVSTIRWQAGAVQAALFLTLTAMLFVIAAWRSQELFIEVLQQARPDRSDGETQLSEGVV